MKNSILYCFLICCCWACGANSSSPQKTVSEEQPLDEATEDDLLTRLSMQLISQPQTQAQKDQNVIVDYAIDQLLDLDVSASGLFFQITEPGQTEDLPPRWGDVLHLNYQGTFLDGQVFDQSKAGKPLKIKLRQVIPGWQEALLMMRKGGKGIFILPSHLGYGPEGYGNKIPPNAVLKFEIELIEIDRY